MLALILAHLQSKPGFEAAQVAESLEAVAATITSAEDGSLFVVPFRERGRSQRNATGYHRQTIDVMFATVMVLRRHDDPRGSARAEAFDTQKGALEAVLVGWHPASGSDGVSLAASETQGLGNGVSILTQTWQTTRFLTGVKS
jgi:hypothetical protein